MVASLDEPVVVWATDAGVPQRLEWRGREFLVCAKPTPWIDRVPWWQVASRAPVGKGAELLEQPMWQVQALSTDADEVVRVDLAVGQEGDWWRVIRVYE
jgi:hypothetical protein